MWMFKVLLLWNTIVFANAELKLCSEPVDKTQLCKRMENYVANMPPWNETSDTPAILTPIIYLEDILEIDHDKKSITIYVTIDMEWIDSEIGVSYPEGFEYGLCNLNFRDTLHTSIIVYYF